MRGSLGTDETLTDDLGGAVEAVGDDRVSTTARINRHSKTQSWSDSVFRDISQWRIDQSKYTRVIFDIFEFAKTTSHVLTWNMPTEALEYPTVWAGLL